MKKNKILASLCMGAFLLSAAPSFAQHSGLLPIEESESSSFATEKVDRIIRYLENVTKNSILNLKIPSTAYGLHPIAMDYNSDNGDFLVLIYKSASLPFFSSPEFVMYDKKDNNYGELDEIYKQDKSSENYSKVELTPKEKERFNELYLKIIDKFYSENEKAMEEFEKALEQDRDVQNLLDILDKK